MKCLIPIVATGLIWSWGNPSMFTNVANSPIFRWLAPEGAQPLPETIDYTNRVFLSGGGYLLPYQFDAVNTLVVRAYNDGWRPYAIRANPHSSTTLIGSSVTLFHGTNAGHFLGLTNESMVGFVEGNYSTNTGLSGVGGHRYMECGFTGDGFLNNSIGFHYLEGLDVAMGAIERFRPGGAGSAKRFWIFEPVYFDCYNDSTGRLLFQTDTNKSVRGTWSFVRSASNYQYVLRGTNTFFSNTGDSGSASGPSESMRVGYSWNDAHQGITAAYVYTLGIPTNLSYKIQEALLEYGAAVGR